MRRCVKNDSNKTGKSAGFFIEHLPTSSPFAFPPLRGGPVCWPNHVPCQTVPKQMGALACRVHSRPLECTHNQRGNCDRVGKPYPRIPYPNEHSSAGTRGTTVAQVERKSFTYIGWQGQLSPAPTFRADGNPCLLPVDVFQVQCDDLPRRQA